MSERQELDEHIRSLNVEIDAKLTLMKQYKTDLEKIMLERGSSSTPSKAIELNSNFQTTKSDLETLTKHLDDSRRRLRVLNNSYNNLEATAEGAEGGSGAVVIDVRTMSVSSKLSPPLKR
tara:strand:- start:39 stop:398 length:360 start_codon:yes stop_codon:yes gene_type:complete